MGVVIGRAKRAPHWGVQSRFRVIYIYMLSVCRMSVVCQINCVGGITWPTRMLKVILGRKRLTCDTRVIDFDYALENSVSMDGREMFT